MPRTSLPLLCFSHLRWNFVYQRPQHVISRIAGTRDTYFWEEPEPTEGDAFLERRNEGDVTVLVPRLPATIAGDARIDAQRTLLDSFLAEQKLDAPVLWYYTPMARAFSRHLDGVVVYDCMDELTLFKGAPPELTQNERELLSVADVVFTGGRSLYYAKRRAHGNVHCFPSAVEAAHFAQSGNPEPQDLAAIGYPRLGFYGVIDERFDLDFVRELAAELPDWELVFLGPVVKIDQADLPRAKNVHYLGMKTYQQLPAYLEHWDVALLPFARNDATRFISPTKTLEYLAAHKPVISTPITDVVDPYGKEGIVCIADTAREAADAARRALATPPSAAWNRRVDELMRAMSWDETVSRMQRQIDAACESKMEEVAG